MNKLGHLCFKSGLFDPINLRLSGDYSCFRRKVGGQVMKRLYILTILLCTLFLIMVGARLVNAINATTEMNAAESDWVDDFNSPSLDSHWFWVREDPTHWSLTDNPGYMRITSQAGGIYQTGNNEKNILLTPVSSADFRIMTKVDFSPTENYHSAGLFIYQDDDNYISLSRDYSNNGKVQFRYEVAAVMTTTLYVEETITSVHLRIDKEGDSYLGYYSTDGSQWICLGQIFANLLSPKVGIGAAHGPASTEIPADFDFFDYKPLPLYNTTWEEGFDSPNLDSRWFWVREDPTHWSLTDNPGYMRITTQEGSLHLDGNSMKNLLLTPVSSADFRVQTRVDFSPTENFQVAGLYIYQDDDNFVILSRDYGNGNKVSMRNEDAGLLDSYISVDETTTDVYLRIDKEGDSYMGFYSTDGVHWTWVGQVIATLLSPKVGIGARNGPATTEIPADFDYFQLSLFRYSIYLPLVLK